MSNIKKVIIRGELPFNIADNDEAAKWMGVLNGPSLGIRLQYEGRGEWLPNKHGGKTAMYRFAIIGQEAVREEWLERLIKAFQDGGAKIETAVSQDIENPGSPWVQLKR